MIYSEDISKICALCVNAQILQDNENEIYCEKRKKNMLIHNDGCKKFEYDIFKKTVRPKRRLKTDFSPEDFSL